MIGAKAGRALKTGTIQAPAFVANLFRRVQSSLSIDPARRLLVDAFGDKELLSALLNTETTASAQKLIRKQLNGWLASIGVEQIPEGAIKPTDEGADLPPPKTDPTVTSSTEAPAQTGARPKTAIAKFVEEAEVDPKTNKNKVFTDTAGKKTVGVGFNLDRPGAKKIIESVGADFNAVKSGKAELTDEQIDRIFQKTLSQAQDDAASVVSAFDNLGPVRQAVMVDLAFNMGRSGLSKFKKMLAAIEKKDFDAAADELKDSKWFSQVGKRGPRNVDALRRG